VGFHFAKEIDVKNCSEEGSAILTLVFNGSIGFAIFNSVACIYLIAQKDFAKLEFYIMYGLNLIWFLVMIGFAVSDLIAYPNEC
jgi:hypothetical protein